MQVTSTTPTPAGKITEAFEQAQRESRGVLIPYFMCGYPSTAQSIKLMLAATQAGGGINELGMPFSDPLADGATIQHPGQIANERCMTLNSCFENCCQISARRDGPLLLIGYYKSLLV